MYEAYVVPISCEDFDILLVSSLTSFGSGEGEALQGHSKVLAILNRGVKRAILTRVGIEATSIQYTWMSNCTVLCDKEKTG